MYPTYELMIGGKGADIESQSPVFSLILMHVLPTRLLKGCVIGLAD